MPDSDEFEDPPFPVDVNSLDLRDFLPSVATAHLGVWHRAVQLQADRILDASSPPVARQTDAYMFVQALRQVLRASDLMKRALDGDSRSELVEAAIAEFNNAVPRAKDARDVLDHFDDYARGVGSLSHPGIRDAKKREARSSAQTASEYTIYYERGSDDHYVLHVGDIAIDVALAREAASRLAEAALGAWWEPAEQARLEELLSEQDPDGPYFVAWAFLGVITGDVPSERLELLVTPESLSAWQLNELRSLTNGYGIASRVAYASEDVAYVKLVVGPNFPSIVSSATIVDALIVTLQRRPDLGGEWRVHALGGPVEPSHLPNISLRVLVRGIRSLLTDLKQAAGRFFR